MKRGQIIIPQSTLEASLSLAHKLKAEMMELLGELESTATGHKISLPGKWRHDTQKWSRENFN